MHFCANTRQYGLKALQSSTFIHFWKGLTEYTSSPDRVLMNIYETQTEKEREFDSFYLYALPIWNVPFSVSVILQIFSFSAFVINPMHWILLGIFSI